MYKKTWLQQAILLVLSIVLAGDLQAKISDTLRRLRLNRYMQVDDLLQRYRVQVEEQMRQYTTVDQWLASGYRQEDKPLLLCKRMRLFPFGLQSIIKPKDSQASSVDKSATDVYFPCQYFQNGPTCVVHSLAALYALSQNRVVTKNDYDYIMRLALKELSDQHVSSDTEHKPVFKGLRQSDVNKIMARLGYKIYPLKLHLESIGISNWQDLTEQERQRLQQRLEYTKRMMSDVFLDAKQNVIYKFQPNGQSCVQHLRENLKLLSRFVKNNQLLVLFYNGFGGHAMAIKAVYANDRLKVYLLDSTQNIQLQNPYDMADLRDLGVLIDRVLKPLFGFKKPRN